MSFNPTVPNQSQSPGIFPTQNNTNFTRLQQLISGDHVFNTSQQVNDGIHNQATMVARADPVSLVSGANGMAYCWLDGAGAAQLKFFNGTNIFQITPGIVSAVNFDGTGAINANQTIRGNPLNVNYVYKNGTGSYSVYFLSPMPDINYIVIAMGMRNDATGKACCAGVLSNLSYNTSVALNYVSVQFTGSGDPFHDVVMGNVVVLRY